jgi:hypothetical protein
MGCRPAVTTRDKVRRAREWLLASLSYREGAVLVRGLTNTGPRRRTFVAPLRAGPVVVAGPLFFLKRLS